MEEYLSIQQQASDPKQSAFLYASAGSGKTRTLILRILRLILAGNEPVYIYCITYTNVAAIEIYKRIQHIFSQWRIVLEDDMRNNTTNINLEISKYINIDFDIDYTKFTRLIEQKTIEKLNISTIHSLLFRLLSNSYTNQELEIHILSDIQEKDLIHLAFNKFINESPSNSNDLSLISRLLLRYSAKYYQNLLSKILLSQALDVENLDFQLVRKMALIQAPDLNCTKKNFLIKNNDLVKIFYDAEDTEGIDTLKISDELAEILFEFIKNKVLTQKNTVRKHIPEIANLSADSKNLILSKAEEIKILIQQIKQNDQYTFLADCFAIAKQTYSILESIKGKGNYFGYNDIIRKGIKLLNEHKSQDIGLSIYIQHLLIDEMQDLSQLQWDAVTALTDHFWYNKRQIHGKQTHTIFAVGDYKQSIFGFQGAEPLLMQKAEKYYKDQIAKYHCTSPCTSSFNVLHMNFSFRCSKEILNYVDKISNQQEYLDAFKSQKIEHISLAVESENKSEQNNKLSSYVDVMPITEADLPQKVIDLLKELEGEGFAGGQIMFLTRARNTIYNSVMEAAYRHNIIIHDIAINFMLQQDIVENFVSLLNIVINPYYNILMLEILKSPMCNLSDEELYELCTKQEVESSLYERLLLYHGSNEGIKKAQNLIASCICFQYTHEINLFYQFLRNNFNDIFNNYFAKSDISLKAVSYLESKINEFSQITYSCEYPDHSIESFLEFLHKDIRGAVNKDGIIISTIHGAKGAESDVVIFIREKNSQPKDNYGIQVINESCFLISDVVLDKERNCPDSDMNDAKSNISINCEQVNHERCRVEYVALTRAKRKLIILDI